MNSVENEAANALKTLGVLGLLRLAWSGAVKAGGWIAALRKRRESASLDEQRMLAEKNTHDADLFQKRREALDQTMDDFMERMEQRVVQQDAKIDRLEQRVADEEEARRLAYLSADAAHVRADEADRSRDQAIYELGVLKRTNEELSKQLSLAAQARAEDQATIALLRRQMHDNEIRIAELTERISHFETGTFQMKLLEE